MESNADDPQSEQPEEVSPGELEEALRWLEEMTAKQQGEALGVEPNAVPPSSPLDGLIEVEKGELPDWLRETLSGNSQSRMTSETESRLDWLAKMAERESIEELPTLQWQPSFEAADSKELLDRVFGDPADFKTIAPSGFDEATGLPDYEPPTGDVPAAPEEWPPIEAIESELVEVTEPAVEAPNIITAAEPEEVTPTAADDYPSVADLDAAMAWLEELAASQDTPIEDIPSVADRALASKLMHEAGLSSEMLEQEVSSAEASLLDEHTPVDAFIGAEDFADTVFLVETLDADKPGDPVADEVPPDRDSWDDRADPSELGAAAITTVDTEGVDSFLPIASELEPGNAEPDELAFHEPEVVTPAEATTEQVPFESQLVTDTPVADVSTAETPFETELVEPSTPLLAEELVEVDGQPIPDEVAALPDAPEEPSAPQVDIAAPEEELPDAFSLAEDPVIPEAPAGEERPSAGTVEDTSAAADIVVPSDAKGLEGDEQPIEVTPDQPFPPLYFSADELEPIAPTVEDLELVATEMQQAVADVEPDVLPEVEPALVEGAAQETPDDVVPTEQADSVDEAQGVDVPETSTWPEPDVAIAADEVETAEAASDPIPAAEPGPVLSQPEIIAAANGLEATPSALESALRELDALALPEGQTLDELDLKLRQHGATVVTQRDLPGALAWLERALDPASQPPAAAEVMPSQKDDLLEESLFDQMPEDPDAVLAWLEQIAGDESAAPHVSLEPMPLLDTPILDERTPVLSTPEMLIEEMAEADLLQMPDDPDEAMRWLEGLARGGPAMGPQLSDEAYADIVELDEDEPPVEDELDAEPLAPAAPDSIEQPEYPDSSAWEDNLSSETITVPDAPGAEEKLARGATSWVDLLKPLD